MSAVATAIGCPPEVAKKLTKTITPQKPATWGSWTGLSPEAKQSIGKRQDVPESEGVARHADKKPRAQFPVHMPYADDILDYVAGHNKMRVIATYAHIVQKEMSANKIDLRSSGWRGLHDQKYTAEQLQEMISTDAWTRNHCLRQSELKLSQCRPSILQKRLQRKSRRGNRYCA